MARKPKKSDTSRSPRSRAAGNNSSPDNTGNGNTGRESSANRGGRKKSPQGAKKSSHQALPKAAGDTQDVGNTRTTGGTWATAEAEYAAADRSGSVGAGRNRNAPLPPNVQGSVRGLLRVELLRAPGAVHLMWWGEVDETRLVPPNADPTAGALNASSGSAHGGSGTCGARFNCFSL